MMLYALHGKWGKATVSQKLSTAILNSGSITNLCRGGGGQAYNLPPPPSPDKEQGGSPGPKGVV